MIRRGFWLAAGAALGVSGYRRASRLLHGTGGALAVPGGPRPLRPGRALLAAAASAGRGTAHGLAFARDVADGMAEYLDREPAAPGRTLGSQPSGHKPRGHTPRGHQPRGHQPLGNQPRGNQQGASRAPQRRRHPGAP